jgi:predicted Holliday junction resolvase-like endonuclease
MDKIIYRGMIVLACIILSIVLIVVPVLLKMYVDINKAEMRVERKLKDLERKKDERTTPDLDQSSKQQTN